MEIKINYVDKKIQDIEKGDHVVSFDIENDVFRHNEVIETHLPIVETERQLKIVCENGAELITSTSHPMCYLSTDGWAYKASGELRIGETVKPESGGVTLITDLMFGTDIDEEVDERFYDITVNNDNNYLAGDNEKVVIHNSSTIYLPFWHKEIREVLVLKNNKGTDDNRVRKLDYAIQFSKIFYQRFVKDEDVCLFSPGDVKDLYETFGVDNDEFDRLYTKYENDSTTPKVKMKARDLMNQFIQERIGTGRMYLMNIDHANDHSAFTDKIYMSNLCTEINLPTHPLQDINDGHTEKRVLKIKKSDLEKYKDIINEDGGVYLKK